MTKLGVLMVVPRYLPHLGGVELHVNALATRLVERGHRIEVATQADALLDEGENEINGIRVYAFAGKASVRGQSVWSRGLMDFVRSRGAAGQIVHVHNFHSPVSIGALRAAAGPVVFTPHYLGPREGRSEEIVHGIYRRLARRYIARAGAIIHVSHAEGDAFARAFGGTPAAKTEVIPNGVDTEAIRGTPIYRGERPQLVLACRLEAYKQPLLAVEALPYLDSSVCLVLAGSGPEEPRLRARVEDLGLSDRVDMPGHIDTQRLFSLYRSANVVLSLSRNECFGLTIAEALAAGSDVVATSIPAHLEVASAAGYPTDGFISSDADPIAVAESVRAALDHPFSGRTLVPSWDDVATLTLALYERMLSD